MILILGLVRWWYVSKGATQLAQFYWLTISSNLVNVFVTAGIVVHSPDIWGVITFMPLIVWSTIMSIKGLITIRRKVQ